MNNYGIGDMLIRLKNSSMVSKKSVEVPKFKFGIAVLEVLKSTKRINEYEIVGNNVDVKLSYLPNGEPVIKNVKLYSRPGRRWYIKAEEMHPVRSGTGLMIVSTPRGILSTVEAKKLNVGGELICEVW